MYELIAEDRGIALLIHSPHELSVRRDATQVALMKFHAENRRTLLLNDSLESLS
jgi:hypothetical protein